VGRGVDIDDLVDAHDVAKILGLTHRNTVSEYLAKYEDMPRPTINLGRGRPMLWLRPEIERWASKRTARGQTRHRRQRGSSA
jgi:predicted DNA-binding transcriptional regulator AlpA